MEPSAGSVEFNGAPFGFMEGSAGFVGFFGGGLVTEAPVVEAPVDGRTSLKL